MILFELDGSNRFFADVPQDTVDAVDGRDNPVAHAAQNAEGNLGNGGGYGVRRIDGADNDGPAHVTLALSLHITDTGGLEVRDDAEVLPGHFRQAADFLADDGIGLTERFQAIPRDGADAADAETRAGERLTVNHAVRQAESFADHTHFILIEQADGLYQFELKIVRQTADVVVRLDAHALGNIGINGSLRQESDIVLLAGFFLKNADELCADDLTLFFGLSNACELLEAALTRIAITEV